MSKRQDYALWLKLLNMSFCFKGVNKPLVIYKHPEKNSNQISKNKFLLIKYNFLALKNYGQISYTRSFLYKKYNFFI